MTDTGAVDQGYSDAYSKLIKDDDDLRGIIAYALYKKQKREFILRNALKSDDPRVVNYHHDLHEERIGSLKAAAEKKLQTYAEEILEKARDQELQEYAEGAQYLMIQSAISSATAWWKAVIYSVLAAFVFGLVLSAARVVQWTNPFNAFAGS